MFPQQRFRLTREALLLAMFASAFPVTGYCVTAGRADFVAGAVMAVATDGSQRPLVKGSEINAGESVSTAADARAQIRFTDGGYVSLQPNSLFRVDEYNYENKADGKEKGFFSLLRGGLRSITGVIGRVNRGNYQVATPAATIGIRGTGYNATLGQSLTVSVTDGAVSLTNKGGSLIITQGQSAYVADMNTAPSLTFEKPSTPPAGLAKGAVEPPAKPSDPIIGDCVGCDGVPEMVTLTGVTLADPFNGINSGGSVTYRLIGTEVSKVSYTDASGYVTDFSAATSDNDSGYDGVIGWARFYGTIAYTDVGGAYQMTLSPNQGIHGVVGIPTATMPVSGSAHYNLQGATSPTFLSGSFSPGSVVGGGFDVNFASSSLTNGFLHMVVANEYVAMNFSGGMSAGSPYFSPSGTTQAWDGGVGAPITAAICSSGSCPTTVIQGFFAGTNAERAGITYSFGTYGTTSSGDYVGGVAAFSR